MPPRKLQRLVQAQRRLLRPGRDGQGKGEYYELGVSHGPNVIGTHERSINAMKTLEESEEGTGVERGSLG